MKQITTFWNYFQKNEQEIINAFFLGINGEEIYSQFIRKLDNISKRIGFEIAKPANGQDKCRIIFTAFGYRKLFPKIIALEKQAPQLKHFIVQAFIKPFENKDEYKNGTDDPTSYANYNLKISDPSLKGEQAKQIQMALLDYNIATKQIKINIYLPDYNEIKQYDDLKSNIDWIVMQIIGEIAFRKHIKQIRLNQMPPLANGLLSLLELPDFMDYLYKINSGKKTRQF